MELQLTRKDSKMLVLTRQPGIGDESSITLPDLGIVFRVLEVRSFNQVRIGIEAPGIRIVRTELLERPQIELGAPPKHVNDDCDVDTSPHAAPLKRLGSAVRDARLATGIDSKPAPRSVRAGDEAND